VVANFGGKGYLEEVDADMRVIFRWFLNEQNGAYMCGSFDTGLRPGIPSVTELLSASKEKCNPLNNKCSHFLKYGALYVRFENLRSYTES
jgi:hypothetical protein